MRIAVLGGSFDPPHLGHYFVLKQIQELRPDIDKILLMPQFQHQWKPMHASVLDRLAMLSFYTGQRVEISEMELKRQGVTYTLDTVKEMKKEGDAEIYWIVGSDILHEYEAWENTEGLLDMMTFLVFPRDSYHIPQNVPKGFEVLESQDFVTTNISSTIIRDRIKKGKSITYLVTKEVEEYIKKHSLYR